MHGNLQSKTDRLESYHLVWFQISSVWTIEPLICLLRRSNLFLNEYIFECANINLFILSIRMFFRWFLKSSGTKKVETSENKKEVRTTKGEWLIGVHTQSVLYLFIVTKQHKTRQRHVRRLLMRVKARRCRYLRCVLVIGNGSRRAGA